MWTCKMLVRQWMKEIDKSLWGELESEEEEEEVRGRVWEQAQVCCCVYLCTYRKSI